MEVSYSNKLGSERTVEYEFIAEQLSAVPKLKILDVGGMPSDPVQFLSTNVVAEIQKNEHRVDICDFRGGKYHGDFVTLNIQEKYDVVMFVSSLEHFPQCTESDSYYRPDEDKRGFKKAASILSPGGQIWLTVPFGKAEWQPLQITFDRMSGAQQVYDMDEIHKLLEGTDLEIERQYVYILHDDVWTLTIADTTKNIRYTDKAYCVGCFVFRKRS